MVGKGVLFKFLAWEPFFYIIVNGPNQWLLGFIDPPTFLLIS
jgi:hypothetical protein